MKTELEKQADALAYEAACELIPSKVYTQPSRMIEEDVDCACPQCGTDFVETVDIKVTPSSEGDPGDVAIQKREEVRRTLEPFFLKALKGFSSQQVFVVDTDKLKPEDLAALRNDTLGRIGYFPTPAAVVGK